MVTPRIGRSKRPNNPAAVQAGGQAPAQTEYQAYLQPEANTPWADTLKRVSDAGWSSVPSGLEERATRVLNFLWNNKTDEVWSGITSRAIPSVEAYQGQVQIGAGIPPEVATVVASSDQSPSFANIPDLIKFVSYFFTMAYLFRDSGWDLALGWLEERITQQEATDAAERQRIAELQTQGGPVFRAALLLQDIKRQLNSVGEGEESNGIINANLKDIINRRYELVAHMADKAQQLEQRKDIFRAYIEWEMELASLLYAFGTEADQGSVLEMMRKSRQLISTTNKQTGQTTSKLGDGIVEIWNSLPGRSSGFRGSVELLSAYGDGKPRKPAKRSAAEPKPVMAELAAAPVALAEMARPAADDSKLQSDLEIPLQTLSLEQDQAAQPQQQQEQQHKEQPPIQDSLFELDM